MNPDTIIRAFVVVFACVGVAVTLGALAAWLESVRA